MLQNSLGSGMVRDCPSKCPFDIVIPYHCNIHPITPECGLCYRRHGHRISPACGGHRHNASIYLPTNQKCEFTRVLLSGELALLRVWYLFLGNGEDVWFHPRLQYQLDCAVCSVWEVYISNKSRLEDIRHYTVFHLDIFWAHIGAHTPYCRHAEEISFILGIRRSVVQVGHWHSVGYSTNGGDVDISSYHD